jgi:hypothetical protein
MIPYISSDIFENRLYLGPFENMTSEEISNVIKDETGHELKGASIRSYSDLVGSVLSTFGFAVKLKCGERDIFVNANSLSQYRNRMQVINSVQDESKQKLDVINNEAPEEVNPRSFKDIAKTMDSLYKQAKSTGYNSLEYIATASTINHAFASNLINDLDQNFFSKNNIITIPVTKNLFYENLINGKIAKGIFGEPVVLVAKEALEKIMEADIKNKKGDLKSLSDKNTYIDVKEIL